MNFLNFRTSFFSEPAHQCKEHIRNYRPTGVDALYKSTFYCFSSLLNNCTHSPLCQVTRVCLSSHKIQPE